MNDDTCQRGATDDCDRRDERPGGPIARPDGGASSLDEILRILGNRRRRALFYYLQEHEVATVDEVAAHLAAQEPETPAGEGNVDHGERIKLELVHTALPKLAASHFIDYDSRSGTVRYVDPPEHLQLILRVLARFEHQPQE